WTPTSCPRRSGTTPGSSVSRPATSRRSPGPCSCRTGGTGARPPPRSRAPSWSGHSGSGSARWERRSLQARRHLDNFDWILFFAIAVVCAVGVGVIYSATTGTPMAGAFHRQLAWLGLGFLVMLLAIVIDYHTLAEFSYVFYALALVLLALTLAFGRVVNASKSWLGVGGFQFQPSEIAKGAT